MILIGPIFNAGEGCNTVVSRSERSEEHTSELQSQSNLVCRLLLEKQKELPTSEPYSHANEICCGTCHSALSPPIARVAALAQCADEDLDFRAGITHDFQLS